jgi:hypothetical protein
MLIPCLLGWGGGGCVDVDKAIITLCCFSLRLVVVWQAAIVCCHALTRSAAVAYVGFQSSRTFQHVSYTLVIATKYWKHDDSIKAAEKNKD